MQAIITTYLPATNFKGTRISARCERGSITIGYEYDSDLQGAHVAAAAALCAKFIAADAVRYGTHATLNPWGKPRACGQLPNRSFAHVFIA
jgi:hypothetical protein